MNNKINIETVFAYNREDLDWYKKQQAEQRHFYSSDFIRHTIWHRCR